MSHDQTPGTHMSPSTVANWMEPAEEHASEVRKLSTLLDGDTPYIFNTRLFGSSGTIMNNEVFSRKHFPGATGYWKYPTIEPDSGDVTHHPFVPEIAHFLECIENDVESHASIHDSWKSMAVCFAIDESAAQGGTPVRVAEIAHV